MWISGYVIIGILGASLLKNLLAGKGIIQIGGGMIRAGRNF